MSETKPEDLDWSDDSIVAIALITSLLMRKFATDNHDGFIRARLAHPTNPEFLQHALIETEKMRTELKDYSISLCSSMPSFCTRFTATELANKVMERLVHNMLPVIEVSEKCTPEEQDKIHSDALKRVLRLCDNVIKVALNKRPDLVKIVKKEPEV